MTNFKINLTDILESNLIEGKKYDFRHLIDYIYKMKEEICAFKLDIDGEIIYGNIIATKNGKLSIDFCGSAVLARSEYGKIYVHRSRLSANSTALIVGRLNAINRKYEISKGLICINNVDLTMIIPVIAVIFGNIVKIGEPEIVDTSSFISINNESSTNNNEFSLSKIIMDPITKDTTIDEIYKFVFDESKTQTLIRLSSFGIGDLALIVHRYPDDEDPYETYSDIYINKCSSVQGYDNNKFTGSGIFSLSPMDDHTRNMLDNTFPADYDEYEITSEGLSAEYMRDKEVKDIIKSFEIYMNGMMHIDNVLLDTKNIDDDDDDDE